MPMRCSVLGCPNRRRKVIPGIIIKYFRYPKIIDVRKKWIKLSGRKDDINFNHACICSIHFRDTDYARDLKAELLGYEPHKRLKKDAFPSLNMPRRVGPPLLKLRNSCAILSCPNHYAEFDKHISFFKFPDDDCMKMKWIDVCKFGTSFVTNASKICSEHFLDSDYVRVKADESDFVPTRIKALRSHLKKDAIPSLKLPTEFLTKSAIGYKEKVASIKDSKSLELQLINEYTPQVEEVEPSLNTEFLSYDCSNSSNNIPGDFDLPNECSDKLQRNTSLNCDMQTQLNVPEMPFIIMVKAHENVNTEIKQQYCLNCNTMLLSSVAAETQLTNFKNKYLQAQKQILQLEEENRKLKEKLDEKGTANLQEEMENIFSGILSKSQIECLMSQAHTGNKMRQNIASALKLKPLGTYRLYNIPRETNCTDQKLNILLN